MAGGEGDGEKKAEFLNRISRILKGLFIGYVRALKTARRSGIEKCA